jgi:hypothetical protein
VLPSSASLSARIGPYRESRDFAAVELAGDTAAAEGAEHAVQRRGGRTVTAGRISGRDAPRIPRRVLQRHQVIAVLLPRAAEVTEQAAPSAAAGLPG